MKKIKNQEKIKRISYSVSATAICIAVLLGLWLSNKDNGNLTSDNSSTTEPIESRTEFPTDDLTVNTPVTNVPDEREEEYSIPENLIYSVYFSMPLEGDIIKSYSKGELVKNNTTSDWQTHNGIDIEGSDGDRINAVWDGVVTNLVHDTLWGTCITIDHGNGFIAKYYGLQKDNVRNPGDEIVAGEQVGVLGKIPVEEKDKTHLHFELYRDGVLLSPTDYLGKQVDI